MVDSFFQKICSPLGELEIHFGCSEKFPVNLNVVIVLNIHWKNWNWSLNSNTLATWCEELTHLKRPWCWERLKEGGEGDDRGWDGWMASLTQWTWVWVNSGSGWWTGRPGVLHYMGSQRVGTQLSKWTELNVVAVLLEVLGADMRGQARNIRKLIKIYFNMWMRQRSCGLSLWVHSSKTAWSRITADVQGVNVLTDDGTRIQVDVIIGCEILGGGIFDFFQPITVYKMWLFNLKKQTKDSFITAWLFIKSVFPLSNEKILYICTYNIPF